MGEVKGGLARSEVKDVVDELSIPLLVGLNNSLPLVCVLSLEDKGVLLGTLVDHPGVILLVRVLCSRGIHSQIIILLSDQSLRGISLDELLHVLILLEANLARERVLLPLILVEVVRGHHQLSLCVLFDQHLPELGPITEVEAQLLDGGVLLGVSVDEHSGQQVTSSAQEGLDIFLGV